MSEFASYAVNRTRKYVFGKSKSYVQTKVKQAIRSVERKAAETIKRTAEDIVDRVNNKRQRTMPKKGLVMAAGRRNSRRGITMKGKRRKFSRALRKRRSGYNSKSLARAMRKIALNASQTKRHLAGTGLNVSSGDIAHVALNGFQTNIFKLTYDLKADVAVDIPSFEDDHFFIKGIALAGQISNQSYNTRIGCRIFIFKDEVSGFDYSTMDPLNSTNLLWYNRTTGGGSPFVALPEPYKHAPKLQKGQNAKMLWSHTYELDFRAEGNASGNNTSDAATFKKYLSLNREMRLKTPNQNKPQCQWWFGVTWYKLDLDQSWDLNPEGARPNIGFVATTYFKDP